jgi:hypothetical protein
MQAADREQETVEHSPELMNSRFAALDRQSASPGGLSSDQIE